MENTGSLGTILALISFFAGLVIGVVLVLIILFINSKMKGTDAKSSVNEEAVNLTLREMKGQLENVMSSLSESRENYGEINNKLKDTAENTQRLQETTHKLQTALASSNIRGQWGERMAEDILRHIGFEEGINYQKQRTQETDKSRPDFTFILPQGAKLNMDSKFSFLNYQRYCECQNELERQHHKSQFLKDIKKRINEVTSKDYINPEEHTLDYVIMFIPNESVYSFILEHDKTLLDDALKSKVVICSPLTLYAVLAVVRQAFDSFKLEEKASQIRSLLDSFENQWKKYLESFNTLGKRIESVDKEYKNLSTTRRKMLERQIRNIKAIKEQDELDDSLLIDNKIQLVEQEEQNIDKTE